MEADISIWRKTGHFYFALTRDAESPSIRRIVSGNDSITSTRETSWTRAQVRAATTDFNWFVHEKR